MGRALLSGTRELLGQGGSASSVSSVDPFDQNNTDQFRKSAKKLTHPRLNIAEARAILRQHAKAVIYGAFPASSRHQTCLDAAYACGTSPDKILRLMEGETANPDALVLGYCAAIYSHRTGKVSPIQAALAQIIAASPVTPTQSRF